MLLLLGLGAAFSWQAAWREAEAELTHAAEAAAEYATRMLDGHRFAAARVDALLRGLSDEDVRAREEELHGALRRLLVEYPQAANVHVLDRTGVLLLTANIVPVPRGHSLADREFHQVLRQETAPALHISRVYPARLSDALYFGVSRRRTGTGNNLPAGAYDGAIMIPVNPLDLAARLSRIASPGDMSMLVRDDGQILARTEGNGHPFEALPPGSAVHRLSRSGLIRGAELIRSPLDGQERLYVYRRIEDYPVFAVAARPREAIVAAWRQTALPQFAIGLSAILALAALALAIRRSQRALVAANQSLERRVAARTAELAELSEALDLSATFVCDPDGTIRQWSQGCERLYGWSRKEVVGRRVYELLATEFPAEGREAVIATVLSQGEWRGELVHARRDGRRVTVAAQMTLRRDPATGAPAGVVEAVTDASSLKAAEAALRKSEAWLRRAQEAAGIAPFEVGPDGVVAAPPAFRRLWGLPEDAVVDMAAVLARVHPEDRQAFVEDHRLRAKAGGTFVLEFRIMLPDGKHRWLLARGEAESGPGSMPRRVVGVVFDVTARKLAEIARAESETRLRLAQEAAGIGTWEWDPRSGIIRWSAEQFVLFGLDPMRDEPLDMARIMDRLHPEDREGVKAALRTSEAGVFEAEFRILVPGAEGDVLRWISSRARWVGGSGGTPRRLIGISRDISRRKAAEERQLLLMREVDHRAKNALAVVQAALRLTRAEDPKEFVRRVEGRVAALARAQKLLAEERWTGTDLRTMMDGELMLFLESDAASGPRVTFDGPDVRVAAGAAQPLSMAVHELATNAVKYGALSTPTGHVRISWQMEEAAGEFRLRWVETGGPPVSGPPAHEGFGSRVIDGTMRTQLGGRVSRCWAPEGLVCDIALPLARSVARDGSVA